MSWVEGVTLLSSEGHNIMALISGFWVRGHVSKFECGGICILNAWCSEAFILLMAFLRDHQEWPIQLCSCRGVHSSLSCRLGAVASASDPSSHPSKGFQRIPTLAPGVDECLGEGMTPRGTENDCRPCALQSQLSSTGALRGCGPDGRSHLLHDGSRWAGVSWHALAG